MIWLLVQTEHMQTLEREVNFGNCHPLDPILIVAKTHDSRPSELRTSSPISKFDRREWMIYRHYGLGSEWMGFRYFCLGSQWGYAFFPFCLGPLVRSLEECDLFQRSTSRSYE